MESKREQVLVGLFVLVAAGLLVVTVFLLSGRLTRGAVPYRAYFKNAGGLGSRNAGALCRRPSRWPGAEGS